MEVETQAGESLARPGPPLRFSLRTLFLAVTGVAVVCGLFSWLPPAVVGVVLLLALSVAGHVAGNAIGTKLREQHAIARATPAPVLSAVVDANEAAAPTTSLSEKTSLGWTMIGATLGGALLAMAGGAWWMHATYGSRFDLTVLAIGSLAFATLGGFAAFCISTLVHVVAVAVNQALQHDSPRGHLAPRDVNV